MTDSEARRRERIVYRRVMMRMAAMQADLDGQDAISITLREMAFRVGQREPWWNKLRRRVAANLYLWRKAMSDEKAHEIPMYPEQMFWRDVINELQRARRKFPQQDGVVTALALAEETGELARDVLQQRFESAKYRGYDELRKEAVQCAVMAMRVALDCGLQQPEGRKT